METNSTNSAASRTKSPDEVSLLGEKEKSSIIKLFRLGYGIKLSLLTWCPDTSSFEASKSKWQIAWMGFYALFTYTYTFNQLGWYVVKQTRLGKFSTDCAIHFVYGGSMLFWSAYILEAWINAGAYADLMNSIFRLNRRFLANSKKHRKTRLALDLIYKNLRLMFVFQFVSVGFSFLADMNNTRYVCHFFSWQYFAKLACFPLEAAILNVLAWNFCFEWFLLLVALPMMLNIHLENTKTSVEAESSLVKGVRRKKTGNENTLLGIQLAHYKTLSVAVAQYNDTMSIVYPIFFFFNLFSHTLCVYSSVDRNGEVAIAGKMIFILYNGIWLFFEIVIYYLGGKIHDNSLDLLEAIRRRAWINKLNRKTLAGCMPVGVQLGGMVRLRKFAPMHMIFIVSNVSINVLLLN